MENIIWSSGEKYPKSYKCQKPLLNSNNEVVNNITQRGEYVIRKDDRLNEKRQIEILKREMVVQTCQNPFLNKDFNDVLTDQAKYLIPRSSLNE